MEVEGDAALHRTLDVARAAHRHIGFGDDETVGRGRHQLEALACVLGYLALAHQDAVALVGAASNASAQLMEL